MRSNRVIYWFLFQCTLGIFVLFLLLFFTNCTKKQELAWSPFIWKGDSISGKYIEKAFIYIPVQIDDLPYKFTMQFDLGSSKSVLYEKPMRFLMQKDSAFANKWNWDSFSFPHCNLRMGDIFIPNTELFYMKNMGDSICEESLNSTESIHIGTIGADLFQDKVLIIDYKSSRLSITDSVPSVYAALPAEKFTIENGIIKLPFSIKGQECKLMFDTGSSPFQLVTTKERVLSIAKPELVDSLSGPRWWGRYITFYGFSVNQTVKFAGKELPVNAKVYYDKEGLWENIYNAFNIWGITGNAYFMENVVIIDYRKKLFYVQ